MSRLALLAEGLLAGVLVALFSIPVVTAYPAFVAACSLLRRGERIGPIVFLRRTRQIAAAEPWTLWLPPVALAVIGLDALAVAAGVPGAKPLAFLLIAVCGAGIVLGLRLAAGWPARVRMIAELAWRDPGGSALLLMAAATAMTIVVLVPIMALFVAGPLALASIAVERKRLATRVADL